MNLNKKNLEPGSVKNYRVLLIEDNPGDARLIKEYLSEAHRANFELDHSDRLKSGLNRLANTEYDAVLLDLGLPDSQGLATIGNIQPPGSDVPILVLTGLEDEAHGLKAVQAGAQDYLVKGRVDSDLLTRSISNAVERKENDKAMRASESRFRKLIQENVDSIVVIDAKGVIRFANPAAEMLFGRKATELIGCEFGFPFSDNLTEIDIVNLQGKSIVAEMLVVEMEWEGEDTYLATLRDMTERKHLEVKLQKTTNNLKYTVEKLEKSNASLNAEITERKRTEEERLRLYTELKETYDRLEKQSVILMQSEKMSAVGVMAAGVAHELNNPMMGILNFAQYCLKKTDENDKRHDVLKDIEHEVKRCMEIVTNLLTFSHMGKENIDVYRQQSLETILNRVLKLLAYRIEKENVLINTQFQKESSNIWMKENKIQEVLLNLMTNALDVLETSDNKNITVEIGVQNTLVNFSVTDSGCGINSEKINKIFDPFFTTKPTGKGTGLGLAIARNIINDHNGEIQCSSEPGQGTRFEILLPVERRKQEDEQNEKKDLSN